MLPNAPAPNSSLKKLGDYILELEKLPLERKLDALYQETYIRYLNLIKTLKTLEDNDDDLPPWDI